MYSLKKNKTSTRVPSTQLKDENSNKPRAVPHCSPLRRDCHLACHVGHAIAVPSTKCHHMDLSVNNLQLLRSVPKPFTPGIILHVIDSDWLFWCDTYLELCLCPCTQSGHFHGHTGARGQRLHGAATGWVGVQRFAGLLRTVSRVCA